MKETRVMGDSFDQELIKGRENRVAEVGKRRLVNIEIQRRDTVDHARRTRFYGAMIDSEYLAKGKEYDDGMHVLYVNAAVNDGSETARLMEYFKTADPNDMTHGDLSKRVHFLKSEEGGYEVMCEISDKWLNEGIEIGRKDGIGIGEMKKAKKTALALADMGLPVEQIAKAVEVSASLVKQWLESPC